MKAAATSKSKKNLEQSVDAVSHAGNDMTEMNLVNDVTGTNSIMMANDQSTLTLNHVGGANVGASLSNGHGS